jgi:signal peptidase I
MSEFDGEPAELLTAETSTLFEDVLNKGLGLRVRVTGRSMAPFLMGGELLTIKKVPCSSLRIGDLIFFKNPDGYPLLHRIVKKKCDKDIFLFQTKGDALIALDDPVCEDQVLGKVCHIEKTGIWRERKYYDMESYLSRKFQYCIARLNLFKSKTYLALSRKLSQIKNTNPGSHIQ